MCDSRHLRAGCTLKHGSGNLMGSMSTCIFRSLGVCYEKVRARTAQNTSNPHAILLRSSNTRTPAECGRDHTRSLPCPGGIPLPCRWLRARQLLQRILTRLFLKNTAVHARAWTVNVVRPARSTRACFECWRQSHGSTGVEGAV